MLTVFSMTTDCYDINLPIGDRFTHFATAGFRAVHWCEHWVDSHVYSVEETEEVKRLAEEAGLYVQDVHAVCSAGEGVEFTDDLWFDLNCNRVEFIATLGGDGVVLHLSKEAEQPMAEALAVARRRIDLLRPLADRHEVRVSLENLTDSTPRGFFDALFDCYPGDVLGFCFDSGHANMSKDDDMVERYADRLIALHLHDNDGSGDQHLVPGHGTVNWPYIVATLKHIGYNRPINLEVGKPAEADKQSFCYEAFGAIRTLWGD